MKLLPHRALGSIAAAALAAATGVAHAAPYTLHFEGVTIQQFDYNTSVWLDLRTSFSGWLTFDVAAPERLDTLDNPFNVREASSDSGCADVELGTCKSASFGTNAPVVTDYFFRLGSTSYAPLSASPYSSVALYDRSLRSNTESGSDEQWTALRRQDQSGTTSDGTSFEIVRYLDLAAVGGPALLADSYLNLEQGFDFASVSTGQSNVYFENYRRDSNGVDTSGSITLFGTLTSATFVPGVSAVPEPGALPMFGLGALVLGLSMWRRRTTTADVRSHGASAALG